MDLYKSSRLRFLDSQPFTGTVFFNVSDSDPCKYSDISLPSSNVDQVVVRTNGSLFAVPVAGPTGQLYIRPVKGTERYTHNSVKLNCHKYLRHQF